MKVGLIGFGKTGKAVASVLLQADKIDLCWILRRSHTLENRTAPEFLGIESSSPGIILATEGLSAKELLDTHPVDVIVDFSASESVGYYGHEAMVRGTSIVTAISNYADEDLRLLHSVAMRTRVIHSPNITLGINFLLIAAKILKNIAPHTDIEIIEEHFKKKSEVSGTAKVIAKHLDVDGDFIKSVRAGGIIGTHEIVFGFPFQTVRLRHESISREAFGNGILFALNNLPECGSGLFTMQDLLIPYFQLQKSEADFARGKTKPWWKIW